MQNMGRRSKGMAVCTKNQRFGHIIGWMEAIYRIWVRMKNSTAFNYLEVGTLNIAVN